MKLACTALLCLLTTFAKGQNNSMLQTIQDAYSLAQLLSEINGKDSATQNDLKKITEFYRTFKTYGGYAQDVTNEILLKNPFIRKEDLPVIKPLSKSVAGSIKSIGDIINRPGMEEVVVTAMRMPKPRPVDMQTAIIDGTAKFLSKRFKQEMSAWYLNTLHDKIVNHKFVSVLFPQTLKMLDVFANQIYSTDIALLQAAAEKDVQNLPSTFFAAADEITELKNEPLLLNTLHIGVDIFTAAKKGAPFYETFNNLAFQSYVDAELKNYLLAFRVLSNGLLSNIEQGKGPWYELQEFNFYNLDDPLIRFFYALIYEQLKDIKIDGVKIEKYLENVDVTDLAIKFASFTEKIKQLNQAIELQITQAKTKTPDFLTCLPAFSETINTFFDFLEGFPKPVKVPQKIRTAIKCLPDFYTLANSISNKQYNKVVPSLVMMLNSLKPDIKNEKILVGLRYASVLSQFGAVENAEQMEGLLESVALPVGSASIKRKSNSNVSLNAYVGIAGGLETAKAANGSATQVKGSLGISAPIGIGYSFYTGKRANINSKTQPFIPSWTLFASAFDIGNVVNARLGSDTSSLGVLKFSHFISLGLSLYFNFRNSPFSAGFGYTYTPSYRDFIAEDKTWKYNADAHRLRLSFLVDIPIMNFYTRKNDVD